MSNSGGTVTKDGKLTFPIFLNALFVWDVQSHWQIISDT